MSTQKYIKLHANKKNKCKKKAGDLHPPAD